MKTALAAIATAAAALTAVPAAAALSTEAAQVKIERYAPEVDASTLTDTQIVTILNAINSSDGLGEREGKVQSLVRAYQ
ncbi:hypothetical protein ROJ8625_02751 [Roseivivax jejudonensis]|uniref:Uncharacterized protein n=1 Tax=Roseivivax jejudonensis TaxID=1529041 RepID=A0A1X6ZJZ0_9RHOB|nr:hypothetical protein [Roseivivax jejudonensis]SLN53777.1 hypothetical protein ROJ8625_02749 [Roseivivax jejudonensis]SLN53790.1 hypothetical protein ROJ8625_02750 [Roseivivax jejudonensis]SLN53802.1 hypothetical protein ROJ8625_02751 [Roseivivax jejudonensis]